MNRHEFTPERLDERVRNPDHALLRQVAMESWDQMAVAGAEEADLVDMGYQHPADPIRTPADGELTVAETPPEKVVRGKPDDAYFAARARLRERNAETESIRRHVNAHPVRGL